MKMSKILFRLILIVAIELLYMFNVFSQNYGSLKGRVLSMKDSTGIIGAAIQIKGTVLGASANQNGEFIISKVLPGSYEVLVFMVGFQNNVFNVIIEQGKSTNIDIRLEESPLSTEEIVITANKRSQSLAEVPVSVSVVEARALMDRNIQTLDDALRYIPGVNMTEYQINIRGSSGYSRGVGNRVLLLLDGLPLLSGDTGEMKFDAVSITEIDRVEVVKGAGSTLYGSSALGGVVNIITKDPKDIASLNIRLFSGIYDDPLYSEWKWSNKKRFYDGGDISYSQKMGDLGVMVSLGIKNNDGYREGDDSKKKNIFIKAKYNLSHNSSLSLNGSYAEDNRGNFIVWQNVNNALKPDPAITLPGERIFSTKFFLNSSYKYIIDNKLLNVKANYYRTFFEDNIPSVNQNSSASVISTEVQYTTNIFEFDYLTIGINGNFSKVSSSIFNDRNGYTYAGYFQDEFPLSKETELTGGVRYDITKVDNLNSEQSITPKLGISIQPEPGTSIRASIGSGFRSPSIGERFTNTSSGGIVIEPNPNLKPEKSWSFEIGGSQFLTDFLYFDGAVFWNEYQDLIEPQVGLTTGKVTFQNITKARIYGGEANFKYELLSKLFYGEIGYTYIYPYDINEKSVLKFRSKHLLYINNNFNFKDIFIGLDYRFVSKIEKVDDLLAKIVKSSQVRVPIHIVDFRVSYTLDHFKFLININNILNYNYIEVIGNLAPIRNFSLTLAYNL
jgi:iron complex outermembrane receptor protein